jgi:hypothetical protein
VWWSEGGAAALRCWCVAVTCGCSIVTMGNTHALHGAQPLGWQTGLGYGSARLATCPRCEVDRCWGCVAAGAVSLLELCHCWGCVTTHQDEVSDGVTEPGDGAVAVLLQPQHALVIGQHVPEAPAMGCVGRSMVL